jgi:hypothetical protein
MFQRALFGLAIAASVAMAQPPMPQPMLVTVAPPPPVMPLSGRLIRIEMHVLNIHPDTLRALELWSDASCRGNMCFLAKNQTRKVLDAIQADERCKTLAAPNMMCCDSQFSQFSVGSPECKQLSVNVTPRSSMDRSFIQMAIAAEYCDECMPTSDAKGRSACHQQTSMMVHRLNSILTIPTGQSVIMEMGRLQSTNRWDVSLGSFFQAEVVAAKERHLCLLVTPQEIDDVANAEPMPPTMADCPAMCQVVVPAPMMLPHAVMVPQLAMGRPLDFVPGQEQEMRPNQRDTRLDKLLAKYEQACLDGDMDKARKLARRCLDIDPTCFLRDRGPITTRRRVSANSFADASFSAFTQTPRFPPASFL